MKVTYKAAREIFMFAPMILTYLYKKQINEILLKNIFYFRAVFLVSFLLEIGLAYLIKKRIEMSNVQTKIRFSTDTYVTLPKGRTSDKKEEEEEREIEMTVREYDMQVISTHISKSITSALIYTVMHFVVKSPQPIMMLVFNLVNDMIFSPIHIEYLRGKPMLRPFSRNIMFEIGEKKKEERDMKDEHEDESEKEDEKERKESRRVEEIKEIEERKVSKKRTETQKKNE